MKKLLIVMIVGLCFASVVSAQDAAGVMPSTIQGAFYTPSYSCIYIKGAADLKLNPEANKWCNYTTLIKKDVFDYDGMNGKYVNFNALRLKCNTTNNKEEVVIYFDNIVVKDAAGKAILTLDFENGDPAGFYMAMGKELAGNGTVVTKDGKKCFQMHGSTVSMYGYNGIEVQWMLPANGDKNWDFSSGKYSLSFDYYVSVKK
jgi:hypothetical protein